MPPQISLGELYSIGKKKEAVRTLCFDRVVELCHRRIRTVASYGSMNAFYEVPGVLVGYPLFSVTDCTHYVIAALRRNGFLVQLLGAAPGIIYISWDPKEIKPPGPARPQIRHAGGAGTTRAPSPFKLF